MFSLHLLVLIYFYFLVTMIAYHVEAFLGKRTHHNSLVTICFGTEEAAGTESRLMEVITGLATNIFTAELSLTFNREGPEHDKSCYEHVYLLNGLYHCPLCGYLTAATC